MPKLEPEVRTAKIRQLNDMLRDRSLPGGRISIMGDLAERLRGDQEATEKVLAAINAFKDFNDDNDPYNEHDFGAVEFEGEKVFFKIDYYAPDMQHGSEDPADPKQTVRVMTVFYDHDY